MSHVDDGQLNALLDGELPPAEVREVQAHLAGCTECARRLEEARGFLAEAGELLAVLVPGVPSDAPAIPPVAKTPPVTRKEEIPLVAPRARGPADSDSTRKLDRETGPRPQPTAKEIAVNVDGATAMTPAIRPVTRVEPAIPMPPAALPDEKRRGWRLPELEKLAWAASLILCLGVGYLANEVMTLRGERAAQLAVQAPDAAPAEARPASGESEASGPASSARPNAGAGSRQVAALERRAAPSAARTPAASSPRPPVAADGPDTRSAANAKPPEQPATKPPAQRPADALAAAPPNAGAGAAGTPSGQRGETNLAARSGRTAADELGRTRQGAPPAAPAQVLRDFASATTPALAGTNGLEEVSVTAGAIGASQGASRQPSAFRRITLEEAVRHLSGTIRLIDGMQPSRVETGPGTLVTGADPARDVIRVTYTDGRGGRLILDQQAGDTRLTSFNGLMQGDTLITATEGGGTRVRWMDRKFWLSLTAALEPDSLRTFVARVR